MMSTTDTLESAGGNSRLWQVLRSIFAVTAGILVGVILSMTTDFIIESAIGRLLLSDGELFLSLIYRGVYAVVGSYVAASLAPSRPMLHALIPGFIGLVPWVIGMFVMWGTVPKWFMPAGLITSIPFAWTGGKLRERFPLSRNT